LGTLLVAGTPAHANAPHSHADIRAAAISHAIAIGRAGSPDGARVNAEAGQIDPRLRLVACPGGLETFGPQGQRVSPRLSVGVRCPTAGWSLYVPVTLRIETEVVVLKMPAPRGLPLRDDQLALETRDVTALRTGYLERIADAEQRIPRRTLAAGAVISPDAIEAPSLVQRGQRVRLISHATGFAVEAEGEALGAAANGERVRVRNLRSKAIVEGLVDASGNVLIGTVAAAPGAG
jgi:flagella basal body P-ring formation protein FlgA